MTARGIIFNKITGEVVARPFKKFKNASELEGQFDLHVLAREPFLTTKKMDGSMGVFFRYGGEDYIATKGSFVSEQANWATKWCREHLLTENMIPGHTYLFEIIYPENKIVVDYGDTRDLILLSVINNETGEEVPYSTLKVLGELIGSTVVEAMEFGSLDDLYAYCKGLPASEEGFVVTFHSGLKVKVKGDEYCRIHRMLTNMTPLAFWNAWDLETADIPKSYLSCLPEEFREVTDTIYRQVYQLLHDEFNKVKATYEELMKDLPADVDHKTFFLTAQERYGDRAGDLIFYHKKSFYKLWRGIHRRIRPTSNILPDSVAGAARLKRILEEN